MKNIGNWGLIVASVLLALVAAVAANFYLSHKESEIRAALAGSTEKVAVVVPTVDLLAGDVLRGDVVASRSMPKDMVPTGAVSPNEFDAMEGLTLKQPMAKGTPVLRHLLIGANTDDSFSTLLKPGQRALTFAIDEKNSNSHLLRPGDYVDVVLTEKEADEASAVGSGTSNFGIVKQRVQVLAAGARTIADRTAYIGGADNGIASAPNDYQTITLAIETREVGIFLTALKFVDSGKANLLFLLRNPSDEGKTRIRSGVAIDSIEAFSGGNAKNGELNGVLTGVLGTERSVADEKGGIQLYQKYVDSHAEDGNKKLADGEKK
ncbi:MAG: cpaB [Verrucomicrobiaceae bacterium]|nr:cpaB [Verrucomicrobiaceae bacterium]